MVRTVVLALQGFHVLFLLLHDWIPLGRLNDVRALRTVYPLKKILLGTVLRFGAVCGAALFQRGGQAFVAVSAGSADMAVDWVWVAFLGELQAWWIPYLRGGDAARVARYKVMFGGTLGFLPERHGISPNLLHVALHACTAVLLVTMCWL